MALRQPPMERCGARPPAQYRQQATCLLAKDHDGAKHKNGIEGIEWDKEE